MMRQFDFEAEVYQSLNCLPMAARRKLDQLGVKISLEQWQRFSRGERLMICHAPAGTSEECDALKLFLDEVSRARTGVPPRPLSEEGRKIAEPPAEPPSTLVANAHALGVALTRQEWEKLDQDERYALLKLGDGPQPSHNLKAALDELLAPVIR